MRSPAERAYAREQRELARKRRESGERSPRASSVRSSAHSHHRLRKGLVIGGGVVALGSAATLAVASQRIEAEQAAFRVPATVRCEPSTFNRSATLPGTPLSVSPLPDTYDASSRTQISMLGAPASAISDVSTRGSETGTHHGRLRAYSQGDGASFLPSTPFLAGETVTVRGKVRSGGRTRPFSYHFAIATQDPLPYVKPNVPSGQDYNEKTHFRSAPTLEAPATEVTSRSPASASGDIFAAPYSGPGPAGPMIFDETGNLVWFDPLAPGVSSANLQVQQLYGKPVLTWWQGYIPPQGFGEGEEIIDNSSYQSIGRVHAGNGYKADLHDFHLTPQGTAVLTIFNPIDCNLSGVGGASGGAVTDSGFQEIDLRTGLVRREWHSLDHVPLADSYSTTTGASKEWPYDYFHINSVDQNANGTTLISARNTWAMYELNTTTGQLENEIGGRHSGVKLGEGMYTAYQHDATTLPNGEISVFDNGAVPKVHPQSRALVFSLSAQSNSATLVAQYEHNPGLSSASQGNIQLLENQNLFVGWGAEPYFSEYSASGGLLFDAHWHGSYQSYRAYRFPWTGSPTGAPSVAAAPAASGQMTVYASWNGDTRATSWRLLAGASAHALAPVATAARSGFETAITAPAASYVAVQALDANGAVLGTSGTIRG